jgi:hypothetical protein
MALGVTVGATGPEYHRVWFWDLSVVFARLEKSSLSTVVL